MRPYEDILKHAGEHGIVLKRVNIYGSGPPVDDLSDGARDLVARYAVGRVFDIGAGCGALQRFLPKGCEYVGIELSPAAARMAVDLKRNVMEGDATHSGFSDDSFDTCVMLEVLEHIDDYETILREAARQAPPNVIQVEGVSIEDVAVTRRAISGRVAMGARNELAGARVVPWDFWDVGFGRTIGRCVAGIPIGASAARIGITEIGAAHCDVVGSRGKSIDADAVRHAFAAVIAIPGGFIAGGDKDRGALRDALLVDCIVGRIGGGAIKCLALTVAHADDGGRV